MQLPHVHMTNVRTHRLNAVSGSHDYMRAYAMSVPDVPGIYGHRQDTDPDDGESHPGSQCVYY